MTGPQDSAEGAPRLGSMFGRYRIESVVGRGGMGVVVRALDTGLDRVVALKFIAPELLGDPGAADRLLREARAAAALEHPHIVPVYEVGRTDGTLYLAMRHIAGPDLARVLRRDAPLATDRTLDLAAQLADALDAAHARGLVHGDVKPGNVLLEERPGEPAWAWLVDFGLTRRLSGSVGPDAPGLRGTLDHLAPELITGGAVGPWTDQYALACVIVGCLTGAPPFERSTEAALLHAHLHDDPAAAIAPRLPDPALAAPLARALAKDGAGRWPACRDLVAALRAAGTGSAATATPPAPAPPAPVSPAVPRRRPGTPVLALAVVIAVALPVAGLLAATGALTGPGSTPGPGASGGTGADAVALGGPDGVIVFAGGPDNGRFDLWAMNPDGSGARMLFKGTGNERWPDVTPDGAWVVFTAGPVGSRDLWHARPDGSDPRRLTQDKGDDYQAAISPDGRHLAWISTRDGDADIFVMDATEDGFSEETARNVIRVRGAAAGGTDLAPAWMPDGRIAFSSNRRASSDIWIVDPAHPAQQIPVTRDEALIADGAPTVDAERRIVFVSSRTTDTQDRNLWSVAAPLASPSLLLDLGVDVTAPDFSPDSQRLVVQVGEVTNLYRPIDTDLMVMDADGSHRRILRPGLAVAGDPRWVAKLDLGAGTQPSASPGP